MKTPQFYGMLLAASAVALAGAGCAKKKSNDSGSPKKKVENVETSAFAVSNGGTVKISLQSNIEGAKYQCQTEINGQAQAWAECPAEGVTIESEPGVKYVFRAKAVSAAGNEDATPFIYSFAGPDGEGTGSGTGSGSASGVPELDLATEILNRAEVGETYAKSSLKLQLGVSGGDIPADKIRFECKRENEQEFRRCNDTDTKSYAFDQLIDGQSYALTVRGVHRDNGALARETSLGFKAESAKLPLEGEEKLEDKKRVDIDLTLDRSGLEGARIMCSVDGGTMGDCPTGGSQGSIRVERQRMSSGSHTLKIQALGNNGAALGQSMLTFCIDTCSADGGPAQPVVKAFQLGSFYEYLVPEGMHVTEYATTKTYNGQLNYYRILPESDPYYLGNYRCDNEWDRRITAPSPSGKYFDYCNTTPTRDLYKWLSEFRLANNHLEIATDPDEVTPTHHDRIMLNVFDLDYEFMASRSRFEQLCMNRRGTIQKTPPIRFLERGFWGEWVKAEFLMCVASIAGQGPGLPSSNDKWWVGGFFISKENLDLPLYECYTRDYQADYAAANGNYEGAAYDVRWCGEFKNPNLLEVVYMTKTPYMEAADFARAAQQQFLRNLFEIAPLR